MRCSELNISQWLEVLRHPVITKPQDLLLLKTLYSFPGHQAAASDLGQKLYPDKNYKGRGGFAAPVNTQVARHAKTIAQSGIIANLRFSIRENGKARYWDFFFKGREEKNLFIWQLKPDLAAALETLFPNLAADAAGVLPEEWPDAWIDAWPAHFVEGAVQQIKINRYERDPKARQACIDYWRAECAVCGLRFADYYGAIGEGFIHVHHITPLSEISAEYRVNPQEDLRPVCPNCHAMLHRKTPPFSIEELRQIMAQTQNKDTNRRK